MEEDKTVKAPESTQNTESTQQGGEIVQKYDYPFGSWLWAKKTEMSLRKSFFTERQKLVLAITVNLRESIVTRRKIFTGSGRNLWSILAFRGSKRH